MELVDVNNLDISRLKPLVNKLAGVIRLLDRSRGWPDDERRQFTFQFAHELFEAAVFCLKELDSLGLDAGFRGRVKIGSKEDNIMKAITGLYEAVKATASSPRHGMDFYDKLPRASCETILVADERFQRIEDEH